jgi:hypothetical protein
LAQTKTYTYLPYFLGALCVVLLAPYAGCHILTSKPHPEGELIVDDSVSASQDSTTLGEQGSIAAASDQAPDGSGSTDKIDDIEKALNLE